jgi:DNA-binding NtrC family response regulator
MSIIELGGYPDFSSLYRQSGFEPQLVHTMRKAIRQLKSTTPDVIVAEFNYQSDFRDRTSSLESLMAVLQRMPDTRVIIFYEEEFRPHLQKVLDRFQVEAIFAFPVDEQKLQTALANIQF